MILAAVARLGFIADLLSKPTMIGYMNGLAVTILVGQLPKLFGFKVSADDLIGEIKGFVKGLANGEAVAAAAAVGLVGIVLILVLQRWLPKVPAVLVMVVLSIAAAVVFNLAAHGVSLVGTLPKGFPPLTIPRVPLSDLGPIVAGAAGIALVSLADTISTASSFAARAGEEVHGNQEMIGIGAANLAAGLFQGFPVSTSGSRTAVAERSGAKTQFAGVVGAVLITVMIVLLPGLFRNLPQPALAAIVITAALSLADIRGTVRLWRQRKLECLLSITAFLGVALLGVLTGILIAVGLSILNVFRRAWWPYQTELGRVESIEGYHDVRSYPTRATSAGLVIYPVRRPAHLCQCQDVPGCDQPAGRQTPKPQWILVAAEPITDVDTTAADLLEDLDEALNAAADQPGLRRVEGPGPPEDRAVRSDPHDRPEPLLSDDRRGRVRVPRRDRCGVAGRRRRRPGCPATAELRRRRWPRTTPAGDRPRPARWLARLTLLSALAAVVVLLVGGVKSLGVLAVARGRAGRADGRPLGAS